ncbi:MAG: FtsX-like permease family protein, partial [Bacteroidota bacterium]
RIIYILCSLIHCTQNLNIEQFISNRIFKKTGKISRPIVKLATLGVVLGVCVMFISLSILIGFRAEIQSKIIGFGSHIQISKISSSPNAELEKIQFDPEIIQQIKAFDFVDHIQIYATKGALIENEEGLEGVIVKGVSENYNWDFFESHLVEGRIIHFNDSTASNEILISRILADKLNVQLNEKTNVYFINSTEDFRIRKLKIVGIYSTDLSEIDAQQVIGDIRHIRKINNWGLAANLLVRDSLDKGVFVMAGAFGGDGSYKYSWNNNLEGPGPHYLSQAEADGTFVIVNDESNTLPDTAHIAFQSAENKFYWDEKRSEGSYDQYIGGYEVMLNDISDLEEKQIAIDHSVSYDLTSTNFESLNRELFSWLEMIGVNARIIIILMVIVAIVNMTSTIIIIILEKTKLIGLLKALGSSNWSIRKIFLINASKMILKGIFWGNTIAISLLLLQKHFSLIKLNAESYSISEVPVGLKWDYFFYLDLGIFFICILVLIIPSWIISHMNPVKSLRFD